MKLQRLCHINYINNYCLNVHVLLTKIVSNVIICNEYKYVDTSNTKQMGEGGEQF